MKPASLTLNRIAALFLLGAGAASPALQTGGTDAFVPEPLPERLEGTGLFVPGSATLQPGVLSYVPQYPLWSDGATKRRWISLPSGTSIDATRADAWDFPRGTKLWKEFRHERAIETRYLERLADGSWRFAAYVWNTAGTEALLAPAEGLDLSVASAPGGRYTVPSRYDCLACHEGAAVPVLGFSALQLSPDRDEMAPHAERPGPLDVDLRGLADRGLITGLPGELLETAPRIAAQTPGARAALGYLHANCGHCHNDSGPMLLVDMLLEQGAAKATAPVVGSLVGRASDFRANGLDTRIVAGHPDESILALRMRSRSPMLQMPPLGTRIPDAEGIALVESWIQHELNSAQETLQ